MKAVLFLGLFQIFAVVFYFVQKSGKTVGGAISLVKSFWLTFAISHWVFGPFVYASLTEIQTLSGAWFVLGASMALRSVIELILCYGTLSWKTEYGIAHDAFQAGLCIFFLYFLWITPAAGGTLLSHASLVLLTLSSLACEVGFVAAFRRSTEGPAKGVYFVPAEEKRINRITLLLLAPQYTALWIILWQLAYQ
jgi:hypothetical protein